MPWLILVLIAYFFLALVNVGDKFLIDNKIKSPAVYTFYISIALTIFLLAIPFIGFEILPWPYIGVALLSGFLFNYSLYWMYQAMKKTDASIAIPAYASFLPLFSFLFTFLFTGERLSILQALAFLLLILGSVVINYKGGNKINFGVIKACVVGTFFLALALFLSKYVYLASNNFLSDFLWIKIGGMSASIFFYIFFREVRREVSFRPSPMQIKNIGIFVLVQSAGATSNILQNIAISIAPFSMLSVINALQGVQYVFLFIFTFVLSRKFPEKFHEDYSYVSIIRKVIATILIFFGLFLLVYK